MVKYNHPNADSVNAKIREMEVKAITPEDVSQIVSGYDAIRAQLTKWC